LAHACPRVSQDCVQDDYSRFPLIPFATGISAALLSRRAEAIMMAAKGECGAEFVELAQHTRRLRELILESIAKVAEVVDQQCGRPRR
jgi:hypothetical protein